MLLLDVNPLLYALRADVPEHARWRDWLEAALGGDEPVAACSATLAAVVRVATSNRVFKTPTPLDDVLRFIDDVRDSSAWLHGEPGPQHWALVERLCRATGATGNLVSDVYLAALALELDATLITADRDFARFPRLRVRHPLAGR
jgi:toxin-antitoxin system PIN domain toxin